MNTRFDPSLASTNIFSLSYPKWLEHTLGISNPVKARENYTANLLGLDGRELTDVEAKYANRWAEKLDCSKWLQWQVSWARALAAYGTTSDFVDTTYFRDGTLSHGGREFKSFIYGNDNNAMRRELMAQQKSYEPKLHAEAYGDILIQQGCFLCENVVQAVDASNLENSTPNNAILDLGSAYILPNRYPALPLHSLFLPKSHDDLSKRCSTTLVPDIDGLVDALGMPIEAGKTRGNLVSKDELYQLFHLSNAAGFIALRNHPLSGMSIRFHDHWHLQPLEMFPDNYFQLLALNGQYEEAAIFRAHGSPFDMITLRNSDLYALAEKTTEIMNNLERDNFVFTPLFIPGQEPMVMIAPLRREQVQNRYVQLGGIINLNHLDNSQPQSIELTTNHSYPAGFFQWAAYANVDLPTIIDSPNCFIDDDTPIGSNILDRIVTQKRISSILSSKQGQLYDQTIKINGLCGDKGHVDTVIHFCHELSRLIELSDEEHDIAICAAILQDIGWSRILNIDQVYNDLITETQSLDSEKRSLANIKLEFLVQQNQLESANMAAVFLAGHPNSEKICKAIQDHDTRTRSPSPAEMVLWDANNLWHVTLPALQSKTIGNLDISNPESVFVHLSNMTNPNRFTLPFAYQLARMEMIQTILAAQTEFQWNRLPRFFSMIFGHEIV